MALLLGVCATVLLMSVAGIAFTFLPVRNSPPKKVAVPKLQRKDVVVAAKAPAAVPSSSAEFPIGTAIEPVAIRGFASWLQNVDVARRQAIAEKKDILLVFGCSDTQPATQELAASLAGPDAKDAVARFVRVVIDFPRTPAGYELVEDAAQNRMLLEEYGLERLPALALADVEGRPYFVAREIDDELSDLPRQLAKWMEGKGERDRLLAAAGIGGAAERTAAAMRAVEWLLERELWRFYGREIGQWAVLAEQVDPDNKAGTLESFFEPLWFLHVAKAPARDALSASQVVGELEPWIERKFRDPDRGAKLHLLAARLLARSQQFDGATRQMEHAVTYQPADAQLAQALRDVRNLLENKEIASSGTGFLVAAGGYVLTSHHVIAGDGPIVVRMPGVKEPISAQLVAGDEVRDLALLKLALAPAANVRPLPLLSEGVRRGSAVAGFGFPLGDTLGGGLKLSAGTISAVPDESNRRYLLDLTVNPGNSGGPLCDRRGNVVGMISEKTGAGGIEDSYGLAIPASELIKFLDEHLPSSANRPAANENSAELSWDKVDEAVSSGVLMIVKRK